MLMGTLERTLQRCPFGRGRLRAALGIAVSAAAVALLLLAGVTPAGASGLSIGAGSTMRLGDAVLALGCNNLQIEPAGTLQAQASTISLAGNWDNRGTFDAGTGTVRFEDGCVPNPSSIGGNNTFFDLRIISSTGKTVRFEAGATQSVLDGLTLMGAPGDLLVIRSSIPGQRAFLDLGPGASQLIDYVNVADNAATGQDLAPGPAPAAHSIDSGNSTGWFLVAAAAAAAAAPAVSGIGLAGAVLLLLAVARTALRRASRESGGDPLRIG
jgi:hypothetical protein